MGFQVGLDLPGSAWQAFLNPPTWADSLPALGKMLGNVGDRAFGFPSDEAQRYQDHYEAEYKARQKYAIPKIADTNRYRVDPDTGSIVEADSSDTPDSTDSGASATATATQAPPRLFQTQEAPAYQAEGSRLVAGRLQAGTAAAHTEEDAFAASEDAATAAALQKCGGDPG